MVSQANINSMTALDYTDFKDSLGIKRDFRVIMNISGTETAYGLTEPIKRDVYVRETDSEIEGIGDNLNIRVLVW